MMLRELPHYVVNHTDSREWYQILPKGDAVICLTYFRLDIIRCDTSDVTRK